MRGGTLMRPAVVVPALVALLAGATLYSQYRGLIDESPLPPHVFIQHDLLQRHRDVIDAVVGDPWRFRLLSEWGAEACLRAARALGAGEPATVGFLAFRFLQNVAIFAFGWLFYRRLGLGRYAAAFGLGLLAWAMTQALYHGSLSFNTYGDLAFYLAAGYLIVSRRHWWIVPLTVLAALNRETSGLIPVMLIAIGLLVGPRSPDGRRAVVAGAVALAAFAATYGIVRLAVGPSFYIEANGRSAGWELFSYNVGRGLTWDHLFQTMSIVPLLALASVRGWPRDLRAIGLAVAPAWFAIHVFTAVLAETRLVLVPFALVFVPGALFGLNAWRSGGATAGSAPRSA